MSNNREEDLRALEIIANENYQHARDHEHLRAQITSILVAASFVLIGLSVKDLSGLTTVAVALLLIAISGLNVWINALHTNRFRRHVDIARKAKAEISSIAVRSDVVKIGNLGATWTGVAALPAICAVALLAWKSAGPCEDAKRESKAAQNSAAEAVAPAEPGMDATAGRPKAPETPLP